LALGALVTSRSVRLWAETGSAQSELAATPIIKALVKDLFILASSNFRRRCRALRPPAGDDHEVNAVHTLKFPTRPPRQMRPQPPAALRSFTVVAHARHSWHRGKGGLGSSTRLGKPVCREPAATQSRDEKLRKTLLSTILALARANSAQAAELTKVHIGQPASGKRAVADTFDPPADNS
jgi:hypothetical protein